MQIFILGGNSVHNKEWAYSLKKALAPLADNVKVHEYAHWSNGEPLIDLDAELKALATVLPKRDDYILVAKSMGSVLAAKGIHQKTFKPAACVLVGLPLRAISDQQIPLTSWLRSAARRLIYVQNDHDPLGSFADVHTYLQDIASDDQLHMLPGKTHDYIHYDELRLIVANELQALA